LTFDNGEDHVIGVGEADSSRLRRLLIDYPGIDWVLCLCSGLSTNWVRSVSTSVPIGFQSIGSRDAWLQTLVAFGLSLLGLGILVITLLFAIVPGNRMRDLLSDAGGEIAATAVRTMGAVAVACVVLIIAFVLPQPNYYYPVTVGASCLLIVKLGRALWLLGRLLSVMLVDREHQVTKD
jgi:hypothetical protein